ncbi:hypothetical protein A4X13_0g9307, partial [Tilletia indica]
DTLTVTSTIARLTATLIAGSTHPHHGHGSYRP